MRSVRFESAARSSDAPDAPPLVHGRFVDMIGCQGVEAVEAAWQTILPAGATMIPLLLSPLHRLRVVFGQIDNEHPVHPDTLRGLRTLTKQLMSQQVAESAGDKADITADATDDVYDASAPSLLLTAADSAARIGDKGELVVNPQTPVRDWFRILNHKMSQSTRGVRLLPLLTVAGSPTSQPVYAAVEVPAEAEYFTKYLELKEFGVEMGKDPGMQWAVVCDYTRKVVLPELQRSGEDYAVLELVMSHDRTMCGVLIANYTAADLGTMRARFGVRLLEEDC
jgi:hypothetical protein